MDFEDRRIQFEEGKKREPNNDDDGSNYRKNSDTVNLNYCYTVLQCWLEL